MIMGLRVTCLQCDVGVAWGMFLTFPVVVGIVLLDMVVVVLLDMVLDLLLELAHL
jgi:hypothetical protein